MQEFVQIKLLYFFFRCLHCPPSSAQESIFDEIPIDESELDQGNDVGIDDIPKKKLIVDNIKISAVAKAGPV